MKTHIFSLSLLALSASAFSLTAQTTPAKAHTPATTHRSAGEGGACVTEPTLSSKIPALPPGPCAKHLYTVTHMSESKLEYASPLVSPEVRALLGSGPTTYSLDYVDLVVGTGAMVHPTKYLSVKYTGYLTDGTKFDSSEDHPGKEPISFPYGTHRVIQGWDTGFEGMHVGGKRRLFIPYQLAYGEAGRPPVIPAKSELIFDMELVGISDTAPAPKAAPAAAPRPVPQPGKPATTPATPATPPATTPAPDAKPSTSPAGAAAPPPTTSSTPASSTSTTPTTSTTPK